VLVGLYGQSVTDPRLGQYVQRPGGVDLEFFPQHRDEHAQRARIDAMRALRYE